MKVLKNPLIVTCTVEKKVFEFVKKKYFGKASCGRAYNNAEVMRGLLDYFVDLEQVEEEMDHIKEVNMFRL